MSYNDEQVQKPRHLKLVVNNGPVLIPKLPTNRGLTYEQQKENRKRLRRAQNERVKSDLE